MGRAAMTVALGPAAQTEVDYYMLAFPPAYLQGGTKAQKGTKVRMSVQLRRKGQRGGRSFG